MNILFLSAEVSPLAKVGGLADVAGSLPLALAKMGHQVKVAMPAYQMVLESSQAELLKCVPVDVGPEWNGTANLYSTSLEGGVQVLLIRGDDHFTRSTSSESIYVPGWEQYAFFAAALGPVLASMQWVPDVVHCNDWHMGIAATVIRERGTWPSAGIVFTIHNLAYQGEFDASVLDRLGLSCDLFTPDLLEAYGKLNFLKAGCVYADRVNTVSPKYALEIQTPEYGCRLDGLMRHLALQGKLSGILNGLNVGLFDPATDRHLSHHFNVNQMLGKASCRADLASELGLSMSANDMLAGAVTRLSPQKGMDLVLQGGPALFDLGIKLVIQGLGDPWLAKGFAELQQRFPSCFAFVERFDEGLAQRIYGGCDAFLMPSNFEPCGLGQLIAMRYGTVPIVRKTGGLADTVFDEKNGFVFEGADCDELLKAIQRAKAAFSDPSRWQAIVRTGMMRESSWAASAQAYALLYEEAISDRRKAPIGTTV